MKVIFESPFKSKLNPQLTQFRWMNNSNNWMFILEDGKKMRTISVDTSPAKEIQYATLAEKRICTCFSWNFDGTQLAMVIDERQIYLWDVKLNQFNHYKPANKDSVSGASVQSSLSSQPNRKGRMSAICLIAWSKVSQKLVICGFGGNIIISNFSDPQNVIERFVDNGTGLLTRVTRLEPCPYLDYFACVSETNEILVMTFDGIAKYYVQADSLKYLNIRFSPPIKEPLVNAFGSTVNLFINQQRSRQQQQGSPSINGSDGQTSNPNRNFQSITNNLINEIQGDPMLSSSWVSYQCEGGRLRFKRIVYNVETPEINSEPDICFDHFNRLAAGSHRLNDSIYDQNNERYDDVRKPRPVEISESKLIDHFWINQNNLICCDSLGNLSLVQLRQSNRFGVYPPILHNLLNIRADTQFLLNPSGGSSPATSPASPPFKAFDFRLNPRRKKYQSNSKQAPNRHDLHDGHDVIMDRTNVLSIAAITCSEIFYYELIWSRETDSLSMSKMINSQGHDEYAQAIGNLGSLFSLERVDDLDLSSELQRFKLDLEKVAWSQDCSMLAVQLTGGYMLAYRTHLENYLLARCGPKTAHLSAPTEITVLNFQVYPDQMMASSAITSPSSLRSQSSASSSNLNSNNNNNNGSSCKLKQSLVINVRMRPSIIAVGPFHLAVGLNNRVRVYQTASTTMPNGTDVSAEKVIILQQQQQYQYLLDEARLISELDYSSIVAKVELNSRYIATLFLDGRLKLSSIPIDARRGKKSNDDAKERTFPDPGQRLERISSFCLTEQIFLYCNQLSLKLHVFCLQKWTSMQQCDISKMVFDRPIVKLRANNQGNKFVCLLKQSNPDRDAPRGTVFLYDLNSNKLINMHQEAMNNRKSLFKSILESQIKSTTLMRDRSGINIDDRGEEDNQIFENRVIKSMLNSRPFKVQKFDQIDDVIWDTDGRNLILIERRVLHNIAILEHTLDMTDDNHEVCIEHIASLSKPYNNEPVYLTQGVVSYQTKLGAMINSILYLHDDDMRLLNLERQIAQIQMRIDEEQIYYDEKISKIQHQLQLQKEQKLESNFEEIKSDNEEMAKSISQEDQADDDDDIDVGKLMREAHDLLELLYPKAELELLRYKVAYVLTILPIYSLNKCKCIIEHLATDEQFNLVPPRTINDSITASGSLENNNSILLWRILAGWSIYTLNLNFALMIYRKCKLMSHARWLSNLIKNLRDRDSLQAMRVKLLNELLELPDDK